MLNSNSLFELGEIVEILMGRAKGHYAVVLNKVDERYVLIADGDKRKFDNQKRKNVRHIRSTGYISKEIIEDIKESRRVSNAKLRYVLKDFISRHLNKETMKGE